ncbi:hypothetical protein ACF0H5_001736 [Mactra antiquata]
MGDEWKGQRIHQYAIYDRHDALEDLLKGEERQNINAPDVWGRTPVYTAVSNNSIKCLETLLQHGADPSISGGKKVQSMTPLHQAVYENKIDAIRLLLQYGADINKEDDTKTSPLSLAKSINSKEFAPLFRGEQERRHQNALNVVRDLCDAIRSKNVDRARDILKIPPPAGWEIANISVSNDGVTPLDLAVELGDPVVMSDLLATTNELPPTSTVLHHAVENGNIDIISLLLKKFPSSCRVKNELNKLPFHLACETGSLDVVKLLIEWNYPENLYQSVYDRGKEYALPFPMNDVTSDGKTALYIACEIGCEDIVEYLLNFTVKGRRVRSSSHSDDLSSSFADDDFIVDDVNPIQIDDADDLTELPIHFETGLEDSVRFRCTNVHLPVRHSLSCVYIAVCNQHMKIVEMLAAKGGNLNLTLISGGREYSLLLQLALKKSDLLMLNKLFQLGVEDLNNLIFEEAVISHPDFIAQFLKYKAEKDATSSMNKVLMKKECESLKASYGDFAQSSFDPGDVRIMPETPVNLRWQNLNILSTVETSWLATTVHFFNPSLTSFNQRCCLYGVTKVDVSNNNITMVPTSLLQLPSLSVLNLSHNYITAFPSQTKFSLKAYFLEEIYIQNNKLTTIPDYIFTLPKIRILIAKKNLINLLPASIWEANFLKKLDLSHNQIISLPQPIFAERKLSDTSMACDSLEDSLQSQMDQSYLSLESLVTNHLVTRANHWFEKLTINDEAVNVSESQTKGLTTLKLSNNQIEVFPEFLSCSATKLETLDLRSNKLKALGSIGSYPKLLKSLDLSYNVITSMDDWQKSDCKKCFCSAKSSGLTGSGIYGASTQQTICGHRTHTKFENLEVLDLTHNKLTELMVLKRKDISTSISHLASLRDKEEVEKEKQGRLLLPNILNLYLDENNLTHITDDIQELKTLKTLTLKKNIKLKQLPPPLGLLDRLQRIEVDMCPLEGPILDVLKGASGRASDITGFLRSVLEESEHYNCMNLMIVGAVNIGKTSLLQHLMKKGKAQESLHFNQRQNSKSPGSTADGKPLSTVGIDISYLVLTDKLDNKQTATVEFRTWDFAGQKEYYATHQYFLSPRSLYLVVWDITKGGIGVEGLRQWLVNIQAQAPGAPVIIVGTHLDEIQKNKKDYTKDWVEDLMNKIKEKYIRQDNFTVGLPRVIDVINVGAGKKPINIDNLYKSIFDKVFILKHPARKNENLLGHKVPKKYIALQSVIRDIVSIRKNGGDEPILDSNTYLLMVMDRMSKYDGMTSFRNKEDLDQATRFLHENGVLCHFEDSCLKDQYFLDPQWLCDQLAKVVSIKEVQLYSKQGIMKVKDLFKKYRDSNKIGKYILSLLNKFEVALQFDAEHLLLPSLLPEVKELAPEKMREIPIQRKGSIISPGSSVISRDSFSISNMFNPTSIDNPGTMSLISTIATLNPAFSNARLYLLTHFPSGFWPRLITRILADETIDVPVMKMFELPQEVIEKCPDILKETPKWRCWQTGFEIVYFNNVIMQVKEVQSDSVYAYGMCDYTDKSLNLECHFDGQWGELDVQDSVILEIAFKADKLTFHFQEGQFGKTSNFRSIESRDIYHDEQAKTAVLAKIVEHIDCLLQDWFPEIGESRFIQSCSGRYLVTRVVPCPLCLDAQIKHQESADGNWVLCSTRPDQTKEISVSEDHFTLNNSTTNATRETVQGKKRVMCTFLVEKCIKNIFDGMNEICLVHGSVSPKYMTSADGVNRVIHIAPDAVFHDLDESFVVGDDMVYVTEELGRGAFGKVYKGKLRRSNSTEFDVAVKVLYDGSNKDSRRMMQQSQICLETVCGAYTTARQEVSILESIEHPHIVPLLGLSRRPLALLLSLAPLGSLRSIFDKRHKQGQRLPVGVIKQIVIQVADGLDYLHGRKIIYRDLKSDNVLVWYLPTASNTDPLQATLVKLADYGISKAVLPGGAKGFGGTPPFIAPEILLHTGRNTYTEKVDIFSFGMFMFELLTCRNPLSEIGNVNVHVIHGGRPTLTTEESLYPSHMLDLMSICWDHFPENRPTANQIRWIASSPQFCHLSDAVTMETESTVLSACSVFVDVQDIDISGYERAMDHTQVWMVSKVSNTNHLKVEIVSYNNCNKCISNKSLKTENLIYGVCKVGKKIWCLDKQGAILVYNPGSFEKDEQYQLHVDSIDGVKSMSYHHDNGGHIVILLQENKKRSTTIFCFTEETLKSNELPLMINIGSCYCATIVRHHGSYKLWHGSNNNAVCIRDIYRGDEETCVTPNGDFITTQQLCYFIITAESNVLEPNLAWTYNYPGSKVYRWDTDSNQVEAVLDCSNKIPAVDSSHIRKHKFEANLYQVTSLAVIDSYLYVGTTWGCIIVANAYSMEPYSVFRCHGDEEFYCKAVLPLGAMKSGIKQPHDDSQIVHKDHRSSDSRDINGGHSGIVTIGRGYCDVIKYVTESNKYMLNRRDSFDEWSDTPMSESTSVQDTYRSHTHLLSWEPNNWEHY